jgi:hypothetical protein
LRLRTSGLRAHVDWERAQWLDTERRRPCYNAEMRRFGLVPAGLMVLIAVAALMVWRYPDPMVAEIGLPIAFLIGAVVFSFGRRAVGWADTTIFERLIDAIVFGGLVMVAIQTESWFIRIVTAVSAVLLPIAWFVAWRRHGRSLR